MRHPRTLIEFMQMYQSEEDCRQAIFEHRWPQGFRCRRCGHQRAWQLRGRSLYECVSCHYQGSLTAGTIFHGARTDLRKWFLAIWLLASTKKAPSAAELSRQLGVTAKTAWLMRRKIVHAMARHEGDSLLCGIIELDEGFIGGHHHGAASCGRRQPGKTMVAIAAEQTAGGGLGRAYLQVIEDAGARSLTGAAQATIAAGSDVRTDAWNVRGSFIPIHAAER
jgi:transposase-like protein